MTLTRRAMLQVSGGTFAGYAVAADPVLGQAIKTDTTGIAAGEFEVKIGNYGMPVYEARPASGSGHPIILVISEIWGVHEYIRDSTRRFAKEGYYAIAPELFKREGGVAHLRTSRTSSRSYSVSLAPRPWVTLRPPWTGPRGVQG
jgi:hypothetical protein